MPEAKNLGTNFPADFLESIGLSQLDKAEHALDMLAFDMANILKETDAPAICDCCGRETFKNRDDRQLLERVLAATERVKKLQGEFRKRRGWENPPPPGKEKR